MKTKLLSILFYLLIINSYSQVETYTITEEFETNDIGPFYGGGSENVYKPIVTYKGSIYFVYMDALRRPILGKIEDGQATTARLDNDDNDPYYVQQDGHNKFSIGVDKDGYIHIVGDMHQYGAQFTQVYVDRYRDYNKDQNPDGENRILYWVSENPEDISSFEFRGNDPEKAIPGNGFTYSSFQSDMNGELYARNRARVGNGGHFDGEMGWVLAKYDEDTQQWTEMGEQTPADFEGWYDYQPLQKAIFWEDNGVMSSNGEGRNWYQGFPGYMCFDFNNRLHATTPINNDSDKPYMTDILYAYSDDGGTSFNRADGNTINELPIRVEEGDHQGSIVSNLSDAPEGFFLVPSVASDKEGSPIVTYTKFNSLDPNGYHFGTYKYWDKENNRWSEELDNPTGGYIRHIVTLDADGIMNYIEGTRITREFGITPPTTNEIDINIDGVFSSFDYRAIMEENVLRGFVYDVNDGIESLKLVTIKNEVPLTPISEEWDTTLLGNATSDHNGMYNDIFQLKSTGIFNENLSGQYVYQTIEGDFEIEARVINVNYVTDTSYAGLMVREGNEDTSNFFGVAITSYEGVKTISQNSGEISMTQAEDYQPSEWLKIIRAGTLLEAYRSDNGENWTKVDSKEITMDNEVSLGLLTGSGNNEITSHARIDHISVTNNSTLLLSDEDLTMLVYPNPAKNTINIVYPSFEGGEEIQFIDLNGRILLNAGMEGINSTIDVSNYASSLYILKIINSEGSTAVEKILIE